MYHTNRIFRVVLISVFLITACSGQTTTPASAVTQIVDPGFTPSGRPLTEAEVPRVSVEVARTALEGGSAVIVDVRSPEAFEDGHIAGAINIPLGEIENNPRGLVLDKEQWIITYCT